MIEPVVEDEGWRDAMPEIEALTAACLEAAAAREPELQREIALMFCDDAKIRELNRQFRGQDKPTNVLSFPSGEAEGFLGDIALSRETCVREANDKGLPLRDHAAHLIIHGMLHLIGYDHQTDADASVMERCETVILGSMGIADPYGAEE